MFHYQTYKFSLFGVTLFKRKAYLNTEENYGTIGTYKYYFCNILIYVKHYLLTTATELYRGGWERNFYTQHNNKFAELLASSSLTQKFIDLTRGLDAKSIATVSLSINRLQQLFDKKNYICDGYNNELYFDFFTVDEQKQLRKVQDEFYAQIIQVSPEIYNYHGYLLPMADFADSVFYYRYGLNYLANPQFIQGKDIIDAGGFIGDSALVFNELKPRNIYSFEPNPKNFALMQKTITLNQLTTLLPQQLALGATMGEVEFSIAGAGSTCVCNENQFAMAQKQTPSETVTVKMDTLDNFVAEHKLHVGLIKTDLEGFEQAFLQGAMHTIKTQKPTLLISIYHTVDDFFNIKPLLESWNLGYTFQIVKPCNGQISVETLLIAEAIV